MFKPENWDDVEPISSKKPIEGYYILKIINAVEGFSKQKSEPLIRFEFDVMEGEFTNFFSSISEKVNKNLLLQYNQLTNKQESLPYFKKLIMDIESSNYGYKFDFNPYSLKGKKIGALLIEFEFDTKFGTKKYLKIDKLLPVGEVREMLGEQLKNELKNNNNDLPFE